MEDKEGWAPATFIDKYKKTSNALRPNFLAPLPNEMEKLQLDDASSEDTWSKPLPDEPTAASTAESCTKPKVRDWKSSRGSGGPLPPAPAAPPAEEKPALPPRRESINKSFELEAAEKVRSDRDAKPLPPKPPAPGVITPLVMPRPLPFKQDKVGEAKKEEKNKSLYLRNEMGLECGHKVSAKEVKKFNLKPVPKQPPRPKAEVPEEKVVEKVEAAGPAIVAKPKPLIRPKPAAAAAKPESIADNKLDITNLRSKLRPSRPMEDGAQPSSPPSSPTSQAPVPALSNGRNCEEAKVPSKHTNGVDHESSFPGAKPAVPPHKDAPQRPPALAPRRPPPPKKENPSSPTESRPPCQDRAKQLGRPPPPKPKGGVPLAALTREKDEIKGHKVPLPPKPTVKSEKPGPPSDKLPPLLQTEPGGEELYLAVADFQGEDSSSSFKVGTVFQVLEKSGSGWWFCKKAGDDEEGWIPSNYLSKKP